MNKNDLKSKISKEQNEVASLKEKRSKLDKQIKEKLEKISMYETQLLHDEIKNMEKDLSKKGLSLSDIKQAISTGDFTAIQEKINKPK